MGGLGPAPPADRSCPPRPQCGRRMSTSWSTHWSTASCACLRPHGSGSASQSWWSPWVSHPGGGLSRGDPGTRETEVRGPSLLHPQAVPPGSDPCRQSRHCSSGATGPWGPYQTHPRRMPPTDPTRDQCFGDRFSRLLLAEFLGHSVFRCWSSSEKLSCEIAFKVESTKVRCYSVSAKAKKLQNAHNHTNSRETKCSSS